MGKGLPLKSTKPIPVKIVSENGIKTDPDQERKWRAQDDIRTMQQAEVIRKDKERMKAMKEIAREQLKDLKKIC